MTLTKSLHTVTAVTNVAKHTLRFYLDPNNANRRPDWFYLDPNNTDSRPDYAVTEYALAEALQILGYALSDFSSVDPVIVAARKQILKLVGSEK